MHIGEFLSDLKYGDQVELDVMHSETWTVKPEKGVVIEKNMGVVPYIVVDTGDHVIRIYSRVLIPKIKKLGTGDIGE